MCGDVVVNSHCFDKHVMAFSDRRRLLVDIERGGEKLEDSIVFAFAVCDCFENIVDTITYVVPEKHQFHAMEVPRPSPRIREVPI